MLNLAQRIKENYPDTVCLMNCGMFYRCYDKDAYIISYLLGYKLNSSSANDMAGFPNNSIKDVTDMLMKNKVDYKIFKVNKYSLDIIDDFSVNEDNCYDIIYESSYRFIQLKLKINRFTEKLIEQVENEKMEEVLNKIEKIVYDDL